MDLDCATRINETKKFLSDNPHEIIVIVVRLFYLFDSILRSFIVRSSSTAQPKAKEESNKILKQHQIATFHKFIRLLLTYSMPFIKSLIFNVIRNLKLKKNKTFQGSSKRWFQTWWKKNNLHTIKIKSLTTVWYTAKNAQQIENWFKKYCAMLKELKITKKRNIINFDEQGVRIGCMKRQKILVLLNVAEFYFLSSENRQFITIFENINAVGEYSPPLMLIIQGQELMKTWFSDCLSEGIKILTLENGFTSDKIALKYLQHYIDNSNAGQNDDWKLMLMNNHKSHITSEFILLADKHRIWSYSFIPHLTYCMQSLNVAIFQQYKHFHDVIIQNVMTKFNVDYFLIRFCRNLNQIRNSTFKKITIQSVFRKSGMYFVDAFQCIAQLRKFVPGVQAKNRKNDESFFVSFPNFVLFRIQFRTLKDVKYNLNQWKSKINIVMQWSDPVWKEKLNQYVNHTRQVIAESQFKDYELSLHQKRRHDELMQRVIFRKRLKPTFGEMSITKKNALTAITDERRNKNELIKKKKHNNFMRMWRMEWDNLLTKSIIARRKKKPDWKKSKIIQNEEFRCLMKMRFRSLILK